MSKPFLLFQAPIGTRSGYGERSRDLLRALIALDKYDIKVISTRWGNTPMNALTSEDEDILSRIIASPLNVQPDIYMQVTVPNEFQRVGKFNIGVTAGIETDICDASWIEGCNKMDLILVSSNHAKQIFESTVYDAIDQKTNQKTGQLSLQKPVEVLFEGADITKFNNKYKGAPAIRDLMMSIKEDFCYLFVGHWLPGAVGEDRKNIGGLINTFYETFKDKSNRPALILKTSGGSISINDLETVKTKINSIKENLEKKYNTTMPNVYIVYGDLTAEEMNDLYNHSKVKAHVSFTKGEGFGRPLLEAALTSKPVIASGWSGQLDFLNEQNSILIEGSLTPVHASSIWKGVINQGAKWYTVNYSAGSAAMKFVYENYKEVLEKYKKNFHYFKTNYSLEAMQRKLNEILDTRIPEFPKQIQLQLPKLKKINEPVVQQELPKIQLPKLKKL